MCVGTTNFETKSRRRKTKEVRSARNEQQNIMPKTNIEIVRELLRGSTKSEVVNRLVSPDAVYVSLSYDNPDLKKLSCPGRASTTTAGLPFSRPSTMSTLSGRSKSSTSGTSSGRARN